MIGVYEAAGGDSAAFKKVASLTQRLSADSGRSTSVPV